MESSNRAALSGVVTIVTLTPRPARSFAMSTMGIMWPCAMNGKRTKWIAWWVLVVEVVGSEPISWIS
ncbi:hypothetical protein LINPERPRIM_LOCUS27168, partial [Linum perenne]